MRDHLQKATEDCAVALSMDAAHKKSKNRHRRALKVRCDLQWGRRIQQM